MTSAALCVGLGGLSGLNSLQALIDVERPQDGFVARFSDCLSRAQFCQQQLVANWGDAFNRSEAFPNLNIESFEIRSDHILKRLAYIFDHAH